MSEFIICLTCGKEKKVRPIHKKTGRAKYCSKSCASKAKRGINANRWKGGKYITTEGYIYVKAEKHPRANKNGYMSKAILIMEKKIGRYLLPSEHIHHINRIKTDNRIENLQIVTNSEHAKIHQKFSELNAIRKKTGAMQGINNPFFGKSHTIESRKKISIARKKYSQK